MFIEVMLVEAGDRRFEDVCRRNGPPRITPALSRRIEVQRSFGLCSGEAELSGVRYVPGCRIPAQDAYAFGNLVLVQELDTAVAGENSVHSICRRELNRASTVLADMAQDVEGVASRDLI